jgi:GMP synthase (glutamine-hydrolysing)
MNRSILIINSAEPDILEFSTNIERILEKYEALSITIHYREAPLFDFSKISGVIISGSPQGNDIAETHQAHFQWLKDFQKPLIGICAGHHVLGCLFGAEYFYGKESESGLHSVEITSEDEIFRGLPTFLEVFQMHNDSISLPNNFIQLARSSACKNQAMRHVSKPLYTFQFHPEYLNHEIFSNFINIINNPKP